VTYTYDANWQQTAMTDATGSSSYLHDPFGELTSATNGAGQTTGAAYDPDSDATSITYPLPASATWAATKTVSYGYNKDDVLNSVTDFNNNQISIAINADGLPSSQTLGSTGDTIATSYDATGTPSSIALSNAGATLQSFSYADAPSGAILSETDTPSSAQSPATYTYDARKRITSMTPGSAGTLTYGYDASDSLTAMPTRASGSYDHAGELTSATLSGITTSYSYDADGQRLAAEQGSATTAAGAWNGARELTSYSDAAASMSTATYDGNGLRATATTTPAGGSAATQDFVWSNVGQVPVLLMDSANSYIYTSAGAPAEQVNLATGAIRYLVGDALGSVRGIASAAGALTATTSYDAWGNPQPSAGLATYTPFGFAGAYTDPTGLIYLINRDYDPVTGQFLSIDPDVDQTGEAYAYAGDDPVSNTDPTGTSFEGIATWGNICLLGHFGHCGPVSS
jgi:RHS repeat-associated protein